MKNWNWNRIIYVSLSILNIIIGLSISILKIADLNIAQIITIFITYIATFSVITMVVGLILNDVFSRDINGIPISWSFISINFKRIFYDRLGYFWIYLNSNDNEVTVYEQRWYCLVKVCTVNYFGDIDDTKENIRKELDSKFKYRLNKLEDIKKFDQWDGSLTKSSMREERFKKILNE